MRTSAAHGWRLTGLPPEGAPATQLPNPGTRARIETNRGLLGIHRATSAAIDAFAGNVVWRGLNTYAEALVCNRLDQPVPTTESGDGSTLTRTCVRATSGRLLRCMHVSRSSSRAFGVEFEA